MVVKEQCERAKRERANGVWSKEIAMRKSSRKVKWGERERRERDQRDGIEQISWRERRAGREQWERGSTVK